MKFQLQKILDTTRDDYSIVNKDYENVLIFRYKKEVGKLFSFNFCTSYYSEVVEFSILDTIKGVLINMVCYKPIKNLHTEDPRPCTVYQWEKDEIACVYTRQTPINLK